MRSRRRGAGAGAGGGAAGTAGAASATPTGASAGGWGVGWGGETWEGSLGQSIQRGWKVLAAFPDTRAWDMPGAGLVAFIPHGSRAARPPPIQHPQAHAERDGEPAMVFRKNRSSPRTTPRPQRTSKEPSVRKLLDGTRPAMPVPVITSTGRTWKLTALGSARALSSSRLWLSTSRDSMLTSKAYLWQPWGWWTRKRPADS